MPRNPCRDLAILMLLMLLPSAVQAQGRGGGGGGWWEKMSGPGDWWGFLYEHSWCLPERCKIETERKFWLNVQGAYATAGEASRPELTHSRLHAYSITPSFDYSLFTIREKLPVFVGFGAGIHLVRGDSVSLESFSIEPRAGIAYTVPETWPFSYVQFRATYKYFPDGFEASDFGDPAGTFSTAGGDGLLTLFVGVGWDWSL